jgi:uncharacterized metal-binding protein
VPNGRTHEAINLTFYTGLAAGYAYAKSQGLTEEVAQILTPQVLSTFSISYLVGTFLVTPDLDLAEQGVRAKSNWGLLGLLWVPYGAMFSHRGLSHTWLVGPMTRLIYMAVVALALSYTASVIAPFFGYTFSVRTQLVRNGQELLIGALIGYYVSQWLHLIADGISPDHGFKRGGFKNKNFKSKKRSFSRK